MSLSHMGLGRSEREDRDGQGPWEQVPATLFLLVHQTDSQNLATLWSISPNSGPA